MRCEEIRELLPLHALGALEVEEAAEVRGHLEAGGPRCAAEQAAARATLSPIPLPPEIEEPSSPAQARLMSALPGQPPAGPPPRSGTRLCWKGGRAASPAA